MTNIKDIDFKKLGETRKNEFVFNKFSEAYYIGSEKEGKKKFIDVLNKKGYVPFDVCIDDVSGSFKYPNEVNCFSKIKEKFPKNSKHIFATVTYFGKKKAPLIGEVTKSEKSTLIIPATNNK